MTTHGRPRSLLKASPVPGRCQAEQVTPLLVKSSVIMRQLCALNRTPVLTRSDTLLSFSDRLESGPVLPRGQSEPASAGPVEGALLGVPEEGGDLTELE